ncbi:hypothetical protein [Bradyrhizobium sp. JYMT SZCCT0428]|uniref:hypothetical protein n=1 Tax=Bradyrhizobium sp. JYMT SZCCT0428 TaxID=2807673 RepID=UPI001BA89F27|nr:hypothetical protein [Bradyrhizobium sp. JYMT SZCCT0428]MBR1152808.1 hypothetical protein [Bradyrhizobium sp. JYMT SZCCT0428]
MTSARQIEANRCNAARSTGPRSRSGKKRSSTNAFRHGLSVDLPAIRGEEFELVVGLLADYQVDERARKDAQNLARATVELERVTQYKLSLIERVALVGRLNRSYWLNQLDSIIFSTREMRQIDRALKGGRMPRLRRIKPLPSLPPDEPERLSEAFRRAVPELLAVERYERTSVARFIRALHAMVRWERL